MSDQSQAPREFDPARREDITRLEQLISGLDARLDTPQGLMREHLDSARSYLLASMPDEYKMTLKLANEVLPQVEPPELRTRLDDFIKQQV